MIKLFYFIGTLALLHIAWPCPAFSEPYSPACESAVEKLHKARNALIPYQKTMELAIARERGAYAELAVCTRGGIFSVTKAYACNEASWKAPLCIDKKRPYGLGLLVLMVAGDAGKWLAGRSTGGNERKCTSKVAQKFVEDFSAE